MAKKTVIKFEIELTPALEKSWRFLWEKAQHKHYFNSVDWFLTCKEVFKYKNYKILTVRSDKELLAIMPIVESKMYGITVNMNPGGKYIDRSPLLLESLDKILLQKIVKFLKKSGSFYLAENTDNIASEIKKSNNVSVKESSVNCYLPIEEDLFKYSESRVKRQIAKLLRTYQNDLEFIQIKGDASYLNIAIKIAKKSYKNKKGIETMIGKEEKHFFKKLFEVNKNNAVINILYFNKKPFVYEIGLLYGNVFFGLNKSFDDNYKYLSPGKLIGYYMFSEFKKNNVSMYDFCRGDDRLKRSFTNLSKLQYDVYYFDNSFKAMWINSISATKKFIINNKNLYHLYKQLS